MTDQTPSASTPPPLPPQSAADAARAADPDDTGVPTVRGEVNEVGRGFFSALFDLSFRTFITRRLASVFYFVGLIAIAIGFIVYFVGGIMSAISVMWLNVGAGITGLVATIIVVPVVTFLAIILLRFIIEAVVALIAIAENTERTAEHTKR
ncbi:MULTISPECIES: DUF4282 domain-containing protein [Microbacterium]|uniref:DUF4282 domain-containing protein n=1 Tax=Microbacterium TaxID=33882 RepID=UPI0006F46858|nr:MULTISPECIES: DUF4282 domain-containing protein [Microbacterium]KQP69053.1 hypothetical protein ASF40_14065 [Microbacterium sp. Leaf288]MDR7112723.1 hypothetical protein [Microbacterium trichothecenolyticum]MDT0144076.1 DUF4282 domain-containing protein [Microbacterium sp. PRC9]